MTAAQIRKLFFAEATLRSLMGSVTESILGQFRSFIIGRIYPTLPVAALVTGVLFSVRPARSAAHLAL